MYILSTFCKDAILVHLYFARITFFLNYKMQELNAYVYLLDNNFERGNQRQCHLETTLLC